MELFDTKLHVWGTDLLLYRFKIPIQCVTKRVLRPNLVRYNSLSEDARY